MTRWMVRSPPRMTCSRWTQRWSSSRILEPRQAAIVESRFFGGLEVSEISELMDVSEATILRDWRAAKAWLGHRLRHAG